MSAQRKGKQQRKEKLYPIVEEWLKTGSSKKELCQRHDIKLHVLDYWLRKYNSEKASPATTLSNFAPITIKNSSAPSSTPEQIEISYLDGTVLRLPVHFSIAQLRTLLPLFSSADV